MTWRDRLRPASFRGVAFRVEAHEASGGRRTVVHEFPGRDERLVQDLGRATETLSLRAYVLGDDYDLARDQLLEALGQPGPGELVHPYLGTIRVQVTGYQLEENAREGGLAVLTIGYVEAGDGTAILTSRAGADQEADAAADAALDAAESGFSIESIEGVVESVEAFAAGLQRFSLRGPLAKVARFRRLATRLADAVLAVLAFPAQQARLVREAVTALEAAVDSRSVLLGLHLEALSQRPRLRGGASAFARRRDRNAQAVFDLFRVMHAAEAVRAAIQTRWGSRQEAERARSLILAEIDALQLTVGDLAYGSLAQLAAKLVAALPGPDADLPELVDLRVSVPVPSLVLAYRLHGDRAREADLVERNRDRIAHPGRIATGTRLEVLSA